MKLPDNREGSTAGGCCVTEISEAPNGEKYILVYPYSDPTVPFENLTPEQITFYFHITNKTGHPATAHLMGGKGNKTCGAACSGCYFQTLPAYEIDPKLAKTVAKDFREQGYDIGLITADSFSDSALNEVGEAGSAFRYDIAKQNGNAWTNGNVLSQKDTFERLDKGWQLGYGIITLSLYNVVLKHPMNGVPRNERILAAIDNIKKWNAERFPNGGGYDIITTQIISKESCDLESMKKVADWCLANGIRICRFNAFANFTDDDKMKKYELSADDIRKFWTELAKLHEEYRDTEIQFGVSEDMSATGIETCVPFFNPKDNWGKFDAEKPYWCRAGYRLFSINGVQDDVSGKVKFVITGCVDNWDKAPMGEVVLDEETGKYRPEFNVPKIETLRTAVVNKVISTCWGGVGNPNGHEETRGHVPDLDAEKILFEK